jgi:hypothetical protein
VEDLAYTEDLGPQGYQILHGGRILHANRPMLSRLRLKSPMVRPAGIAAPCVAPFP